MSDKRYTMVVESEREWGEKKDENEFVGMRGQE
jgi:hypothetical protein